MSPPTIFSHDTISYYCPYCQQLICQACRQPWHYGQTCEEAKQAPSESRSLIEQTTKPCPHCGFRVTHYHGHGCHHIMPGSGCPKCHEHFCYACLSKEKDHQCTFENCRTWTSFCSTSNLENHMVTHPYHHDNRCGCAPCPDCRPGNPCNHCHGNCIVCFGSYTDHLPR